MTSGRTYARQIDDAIAELDGKLRATTSRYNALTQEQTSGRNRIAAAFRDMARLHVDAIHAHEIAANDALSQDASRVLDRRAVEHASLSAHLTSLHLTLDTQLAAEREAQENRDQAAQHIADICAQVDDALRIDPAHRVLAEACSSHGEKSIAAHKKADAAVDERDAKRGAYEGDPIFAYLRERGYGTKAYRSWPIVRTVDGWLASLCRFKQASEDYNVLIALPEFLAEHAESMARSAQDAAQRAMASRRAALEAANIAAAERALDARDAALARADQAVDGTRAQIRTTGDAIEAIERWQDDAGDQLLARMSAAFGRESLADLYDRVAATGAKDDDLLLQEIIQLRTRSEVVEAQARVLDTEIKELKRRVERLQNVRTKYRSQYNSSDYTIRGSSASDLLTGYVAGKVLEDALWGGIQRSASYDPPASSSSSSSSSGFGGGGFSSGGSIGGGGGFSTGGGF